MRLQCCSDFMNKINDFINKIKERSNTAFFQPNRLSDYKNYKTIKLY